MKKFVVSVLFVLSITLINAQKPNESSRLEKLNLKPIEFVFDEQVGQIDKESKALRVNWNESFKSEAKEVNEIATSYLQEKKDIYGLNSISDNAKIIKTTSFVNQTVSTNKIVFSCSDLNVQDVKVQSGAKLILDAAGDVIINGEFEVELGSELEIK